MDWSPFMREAIAEARLARGHTHPNPAVGALVVHQGQVVARGRTQPPPGMHAEKQAIAAWQALGAPLDDSTTLVVTLEPCCTHGRTPPCTGTILASGIRRVVVGSVDPNPQHAGRAYPLLREAGVEVVEGVLAEACDDLNLVFNHWIATGEPLLALKVAVTLDGHTATRTGDSKWITGPAAREDVHRWRHYFPAIGTGAGTLLHDDPQLTARLREGTEARPRFVFDRSLRSLGQSSRDLQLFSDPYADLTVTVIPSAHRERLERWAGHFDSSEHLTDEVRALTGGSRTFWLVHGEGPAFWRHFRQALLVKGLTGLYLEAGSNLTRDLWLHRQVDYLFVYQAPKLVLDPQAPTPFHGLPVNRMADALELKALQVEHFGPDTLYRGWVKA
ncbi:MAG: bifunctional diaminohydroxyphosphoribosylaminopyrimidine deaminase/5-amino-6-(5-phosphoribosylamino)uracil reductase RibD [Verrucomicrobiota bacterium JB022]|nr:bifunctional diaminohydroxyphosphoribosylaminopyrimidine deaminase/5-amino-6-(5-phosphoribosylamino)uracil reductase RibD [Verrucomicrobiota bacterium JB022]